MLVTSNRLKKKKMSSRSRPAVHPVVEAPPPMMMMDHAPIAAAVNNNDNNNNNHGDENVLLQQRVRMKDIQGMPGTIGGLLLRFSQSVFAVAALSVMATTSDFASVTAFCYLVAVIILQTLWSLSLAFLDTYALLVGRCLQNTRIVCIFTIGDGNEVLFPENVNIPCAKVPRESQIEITSTLTFAAACASAGITVLIGNDIGSCAQNHCSRFETATAMAFLSWFSVSPSFLLNFWSLASR